MKLREYLGRCKTRLSQAIKLAKIKRASGRVARRTSSGEGLRINGDGVITMPSTLNIGKNVHIGNNYYIDSRGGVEIGDNTHISRNFVCYSANHQYEDRALPYDESIVKREVVIGPNVWIGMNVCIVPGVKIGEGAIIGMGAVVSRNLPPLSIAVGNPAKVVKYRDKDRYNDLNRRKQYGGINGRLIKPKT